MHEVAHLWIALVSILSSLVLQGYVNKCITGFTPEQLEYACNIFERFRIFQDNTEFCFVDVIVEWNDNPNPVKVHVENNGVYRLEVDGALIGSNN